MGVKAIRLPQQPGRQPPWVPPRPPHRRTVGVDQFLCVFGDQPASGSRSTDLNMARDTLYDRQRVSPWLGASSHVTDMLG